MPIRIFTIPFEADKAFFADDALARFLLNKQVKKMLPEFFQLNGQAYWTVFVEYESVGTLEETEKEIENLFSQSANEWNALLVETRRKEDEMVFPISFTRNQEPNTVYFIVEGNEMSAFVFIPTLVVEEFVTEVTLFQHLVKEVAHFAGKTPTSLRFTIGSVSMEWDDLVERGCAREVDIGF